MTIPIIAILFLIGLGFFLLLVFDVLSSGTFILVFVGGLFLFAFFVDYFNKKHNRKVNYKKGFENVSESEEIFKEKQYYDIND